MAFVLTTVGAIGTIAGCVALVLAALVWFRAPTRPANARLALVLALDGLGTIGSGGAMYLTDDVRTAYAFQFVGIVASLGAPFAYLALLGTLRTPWTRPFRGRAATLALTLAALALILLALARNETFVVGMRRPEYAPWDSVGSPNNATFFYATCAVLVYALASAVDALRRASSRAERHRSRAFLAAFAVRDGSIVVVAILDFWLNIWPHGSVYGLSLGVLAYVPLLAYGILRAQVLDIDLRIKWTIRRGTLVGILLVAFVVVAEVAQNWLSDAYGYLAGGLAAGALLLALRPLDRVATRVAERAMPGVEQTPAYIAYRKMEVYRAALEGALHDGEITAREREMLRRLRESLALSDADASALERDISTRG